jgi:hypothetical protein
MEYLAMSSGIYLSVIAFMMETANLRSLLLFKVTPGLLGFVQIAAGASALGFT